MRLRRSRGRPCSSAAPGIAGPDPRPCCWPAAASSAGLLEQYGWQTFKIMLKATGHRDPLWLDSRSPQRREGGGLEQVNAVADGFVDTLARGAAIPSGALIRFGSSEDDAGWVPGWRW